MIRRLLFVLFLLTSTLSYSQSALLLVKKKQSAKTGRFKAGDDIKVFTHGDREIAGVLGVITPKAIYISGSRVALDSIHKIRKYNKALIANGFTVSAAGVVFAGILTVNQLINNEPLGLEQNSYIVASGFVVAGLLIARMGYKTYKLDEKHYFDVIDFTRFAEPP